MVNPMVSSGRRVFEGSWCILRYYSPTRGREVLRRASRPRWANERVSDEAGLRLRSKSQGHEIKEGRQLVGMLFEQGFGQLIGHAHARQVRKRVVVGEELRVEDGVRIGKAAAGQMVVC